MFLDFQRSMENQQDRLTPSNTSRNDPEEKQRYIRKIASAIVDEIFLDKVVTDHTVSSVLLREDQAKAAKSRNAMVVSSADFLDVKTPTSTIHNF